MRFLLALNHYFDDRRSGALHSLRTLTRWLADAGHECRVLTTARLETPMTPPIETHLARVGAGLRWAKPSRSRSAAARRPVARYSSSGAAVTMLMTRHNDESKPDRAEAMQYDEQFEQMLDGYRPDQVIASNGHFMIRIALELAQRRGITAVFTLRAYGYDDRRYFEHVDHVFSNSAYLTEAYRKSIGLISTPIEPPIEWSKVIAPTESRAFVTFVNPLPSKGLALFARLADMLGSRRPDIPILVVQSSQDAGLLNVIPGFDFTRYPQIMTAPSVEEPREYFALTRLLLVPSVFEEPFGRVAAEAMINGIPALVSNRGYLPTVIGGDVSEGGAGRVLPIPDWLTPTDTRIPGEDEVQPWYDAVCALWDDPGLYEELARRAQQLARSRYSEAVSRRSHVDYLTALRPGGQVFADRDVESPKLGPPASPA